MKTFFYILLLTIGLSAEPVYPKLSEPVTDLAKMLTEPQKAELDGILTGYQQRTGNAVVVVIVPSLEGVSVEEYANRLFHSAGIGDKDRDNGVLFLWATKERKVRIEVGYGLEGAVPDGRAGIIIRDSIIPAFKQEQWYSGVTSGVTEILKQLELKPEPTPLQPVSEGHPLIVAGFVIGFIAVFGTIVYFYLKRKHEIELAQQRLHDEMEAAVAARARQRRDHDSYSGLYIPSPRPAPVRREPEPEHHERRREPEYSAPVVSSWEPASSSSSSDFGSSFGGFGGGDSGGGGASGGY